MLVVLSLDGVQFLRCLGFSKDTAIVKTLDTSMEFAPVSSVNHDDAMTILYFYKNAFDVKFKCNFTLSLRD